MPGAAYIHVQVGGEDIDLALLAVVEVHQKLNDHWRARVIFRSVPDTQPDVASMFGQPLAVYGYDLQGTQHPLFLGLVNKAELIYEVTGSYGAEVDGITASWQMDLSEHQTYFLKQTAQATAQQVVSNSGLQLKGSIAGEELSRVQWGETDWRFLLRLVDDGEAWLRPTQDGLETQTSFQSGPTLEWRQGEYGLMEFSGLGRVRPQLQGGAHYDHRAAQSQTYSAVKSDAAFYGPWSALTSKTLTAGETIPEATVTGRHRATTLDSYQQQLQMESRRQAVNSNLYSGISRSPEVMAGNEVTLSGVDPDINGSYGVIECLHRWTPRGFENHFQATTAKRWFAPERIPPPTIDGIYPASVAANHDPHNLGRIQIQFHWQDQNTTTWARLITGHAGSGRGTLVLPEIGDEVAVRFEGGDPERPYILGSVWNGVQQPPSQGFWDGGTNGGEFAGNNIKRLVTKSGHRITMVDTAGQETIAMATPSSNRLVMTEKTNETGRPAIALETTGDIILSAPNGRIHFLSQLHSKEVGSGGGGAGGGSGAAATAAPPPASTVVPVAAPVSSASNLKETDYDGTLIGNNCQPLTQKLKPGERLSDQQIKSAWNSAYVSNSPCCQAKRASGAAAKHIIYVNGIRTDKAGQCETLKRIANQTCAQVLGVHNSTDGTMSDLWQSKEDKSLISQARAGRPFAMHDGRNPAVDSLSDVIYNSTLDGDPPEVWAHSQGGAIASLASYDANNELIKGGYSQGVSGIDVTSFGSAAQNWPSSLNGQHFINIRDLTPMETGLGGNPVTDSSNVGPNQQVIRFQGDPGSQDPAMLSAQQLADMNKTITVDPNSGIPVNEMPPLSMTAYHDINTTYLNAVRKVDGGCSPDGN